MKKQKTDRLAKERTTRENIWANYDPERMKAGLRDSAAGALLGVNTKHLLEDIHRSREQRRSGDRPS